MAFQSHATEFHGLPTVDFEGVWSWPWVIWPWRAIDVAYALRTEYKKDYFKLTHRLDLLLSQPGAEKLTALIIGAWNGAWEGDDSSEIIAALIARAGRLARLKAIFLGDMPEYQISGIKQSDVSPLLTAFPHLEEFRVRGGTGLSFSPIQHDCLKKLAVETVGLTPDTLREIFLCRFPALETLELFLGDTNNGASNSVDDFQPLLADRLYPKLKSMGLMNSEITDDIAAVVVNSPIVRRIETLDLSLGTLTDAGARSLMHLPTDARLRRLDISHHYLTPAVLEELERRLPFEVIADDPHDPNVEWPGPVHVE